MTTNPLYNALLAIGYIAGIIGLITFASSGAGGTEDSIFIPMGMVALLTLSVAVMAYLFFYKPVMLLLDGERERGVKLFLRTVGIFAGITLIVFLISLLVSR